MSTDDNRWKLALKAGFQIVIACVTMILYNNSKNALISPQSREQPAQISPNANLIQGETLTFQINLNKVFGTEIDFTQYEIVGLELISTTIMGVNQLASIDVDILLKNELEGE